MFKLIMKGLRKGNFLPHISDTEREALEAGHVWIERGFFTGNPRFKEMLAEPYSRVSAEEQAFIDGPVEELCRMFDKWQVETTHVVPENVVQRIKDNGMRGQLMPKEYG